MASRIVASVCGLAAMAALVVYREPIWSITTNLEALQHWVESLGAIGPLSIIALQIVQIVIAPIPGQVVGMAASYVYGFWAGSLLSLLGGAIGITSAILLGRVFGRPLVRRVADEKVITFIERFDHVRSPVVWTMIFALPVGDALCFVVGLTSVSLPRLLIPALIGRLPGLLLASFAGSGSQDFGPYVWAVSLVIGAAAFGLTFIHADRIRVRALAIAKVGDETEREQRAVS